MGKNMVVVMDGSESTIVHGKEVFEKVINWSVGSG